MWHRAGIVAATFLTVNASGCAPPIARGPAIESKTWTEYLGGPGRAPSAGESFSADPSLVWQTKVGPAVVGSVALGDSVLAVQGTNRHLWVLWRHSGERAWRARLNAPGVTGPLLTATQVFAASGGTDGKLHAYSLANGRRIWSTRVGRIQGGLARSHTLVIAATEDGWIAALQMASGDVAWRRRLPGHVRSGVTVVEQRLFVATDDSLYLVRPDDGAIVRSVATPGAIVTPPAITGALVAVTSPQGFIALLHASTLEERWRIDTDEAVFGSPVIARDTVFAVTIAGELWSIPVQAPHARRRTSLGVSVRAPPAPIARGLLVGTLSGQLLLFDSPGHAARVKLQLEGPLEQPPILSRGDLFIADGRGVVQLWR